MIGGQSEGAVRNGRDSPSDIRSVDRSPHDGDGLAVILAAELFLLVFGAIILAVFVRALSDFLADKAVLSSRASFGFVTAALLGLISLGGWLLSPMVVEQFEDLVGRLPTLFERLEELMGRVPGAAGSFGRCENLRTAENKPSPGSSRLSPSLCRDW
jgi:hypothetical protein